MRRRVTIQGRIVYDRDRHYFNWRDIKRILDKLPEDSFHSGSEAWEAFKEIAHYLLPGIAWQIIEACEPVILAWLNKGGPQPGEPGNPA